MHLADCSADKRDQIHTVRVAARLVGAWVVGAALAVTSSASCLVTAVVDLGAYIVFGNVENRQDAVEQATRGPKVGDI